MRDEVDLRNGSDVAAPGRSLGELFSDLARETSELVRQEVQLARIEVQQEVRKAGRAGGMIGAAGIAAGLAALLLSFAAAWALALVMPTALGFLIVGVVEAAIAAGLFVAGRSRMQDVDPVPRQTTETVKEDVQWLKAQTR